MSEPLTICVLCGEPITATDTAVYGGSIQPRHGTCPRYWRQADALTEAQRERDAARAEVKRLTDERDAKWDEVEQELARLAEENRRIRAALYATFTAFRDAAALNVRQADALLLARKALGEQPGGEPK